MINHPAKVEDWLQVVFNQDLSFLEKNRLVYDFQYQQNEIYRGFIDALDIHGADELITQEIPLLPIEAYRDAIVKTGNWIEPELVFRSSGTSAMSRSRHEIYSAELYRQSLLRGFNMFYPLEPLVILGYTPGYSDNPHSSLIWMIRELIKQDDSGLSHFLPLDKPLDEGEIQNVAGSGKSLMLFGAAFGLLDLIERGRIQLPEDTIVMETGGMKTYKREVSRTDLHRRLADGFGIPEQNIHSEYGMAEMLSQAYQRGQGGFETPPWMEVTIRDPKNPMKIMPAGQEGLIGVIDLANVYSCSFLLTGDRGIMDSNRRFSVLGRWKTENLRGCNFLIDQER